MSTPLSHSYPHAKSPGVCAATQRSFTPGEVVIAALVELPGQSLTRMDFSLDAWQQGQRPPAPASVFGFWRTEFQPKERQGPRPIMGDSELLEIFDALGEASDPKQVRFRYVLALLLIRRRMLRVVGHARTPQGSTLSVYRRGEQAGVHPPLSVVDPGLDEVALAEAVEQLLAAADGSPQPQAGAAS